MGMSMHVEGIKPPDETFKKMLAVYKSCDEAGIVDIPKEVYDYFEGETPDEMGVVVLLGSDYGDKNHQCCELFGGDGRNGFVIDVSRLPKDIRFVRFVISY